MGIFSFNKFITEKFGISNPSLVFASILKNRTYYTFREFFLSGENTLLKTDEIDYILLRPHINTSNIDDYSEFPVIKFELVLDFKKLKNKDFQKKYPDFNKNIATGGVASYFGNINWSGYSKIVDPIKQISDQGIVVNLGITIEINEDFNIRNESEKELLENDIDSTIHHELNHCYEHYVRVIKSSEVRPERRSFNTSLSWGPNIWKFPKPIYKFWYKFTYYLYVSEYHEIRANVQEIGFFIKKYPKKDLAEFQIYKTADAMEKFDHMDYYNRLISVIKTHEPYIGIEDDVANRLKDMWVSTYKKECEQQRVKPVIPISTLKKMDCKEFLKYWQKRINFAGQRIKRKANAIKSSI